ncbi:hypothetical protein BG006_005184 [Podila minutissima]|uniref:Uncharacterized protein n=1 Tax=Podila minutissima TaxID=64525 RepID=A0A9P5SMS0_9FUNG|nr:hypothetical protein BG006_005184 [Podila minutissima]
MTSTVSSIQDIHRDGHPENTIVEDSGSTTASQIRRPKRTWDCIYSTVHPVERVLTKDDFMVDPQLPDRDQENDADENKNNDEPTTSAHDLDDNGMNLHTLPSHVLDDLFAFLFAVEVVRREESRLQLCRKWLEQDEEEDQSAESLLRMRQMIMDRTIMRRSAGRRPCLGHPDGYCPKRSSQDHTAESVRRIEELVNQAGL